MTITRDGHRENELTRIGVQGASVIWLDSEWCAVQIRRTDLDSLIERGEWFGEIDDEDVVDAETFNDAVREAKEAGRRAGAEDIVDRLEDFVENLSSEVSVA